MRALALLLVVALSSGCVLSLERQEGRVIAGDVDGSSATNQYLKVWLRSPDADLALANFDRRDWYVAGLERAISQKEITFASVRGADRDLLNEVVVRDVLTPEDANDYRYDRMAERAEARGEAIDVVALDHEWTLRLLAAADGPAAPVAPAAPALPHVPGSAQNP